MPAALSNISRSWCLEDGYHGWYNSSDDFGANLLRGLAVVKQVLSLGRFKAADWEVESEAGAWSHGSARHFCQWQMTLQPSSLVGAEIAGHPMLPSFSQKVARA